ncbi:FUSC family protein [Roseovarius aquimarinus]|uniref:FUSC family protein n=1 Tax=Roseovarius aquimarinus TaxID=1229156 RepID=A0ABW7I3Q9_9RHOB
MYVPPRPSPEDDPHYAIRLGLTGALSVAAIPLMEPNMPTIMAALPAGLIAAQRKAFNPVLVIAAVVAVCILATLMAWVVNLLQPLPVIYAGAMWLVYFLGFGMILRTGAAPGMLLVIMAVLFSVVGMNGSAAVAMMRAEFFSASLVGLVVIPLAYALVPARTRQIHVAEPVPPGGDAVVGAAIRASVLMALTFWLYAVMPPSDIMLAIMAAMVLVFPTRQAVFFEAGQRMRATLYGSALAVAVVAVYPLSPKLPILLGLVFLAGLWVGTKVLYDPRPHMAYQNAYPAAMALIAGALSTQDLGQAVLSRVLLTLVGAFTAAYAVALLDSVTGWRERAGRGMQDGAAGDPAAPPEA